MKALKDFFSLSKTELQGALVFVLLLLIVAISYYMLPQFVSASQTDFSEFDQDLQALVALNEDKDPSPITKAPKDIAVKMDFFDPNKLTYSEWLEIGVPAKIAGTIQNYLTKGGHFYEKDDLLKIYGLNEKLYTRLEPYIRIEKQSAHITKHKTTTLLVDINKGTEVDFKKIRGIGDVFSARIVKYRKLLGGYYTVEQIREVYGIDSVKFNAIKPFLAISEITIDPEKKININEATLSQFKVHPYLRGGIAGNIIQSREKSGRFLNVNDLLEREVLTSQEFDKIKYYLNIN